MNYEKLYNAIIENIKKPINDLIVDLNGKPCSQEEAYESIMKIVNEVTKNTLNNINDLSNKEELFELIISECSKEVKGALKMENIEN